MLRSHRYARRTIARVERLLRLHPIEQGAEAAHDASVRRLLRRAGENDFDALVALRRAELEHGEAARRSDAAAASERLRELEQAAARVRRSGALALHRFDLAIRGDEVMRLLGCRPGPQVGRALRFLTECVIEDPGLQHAGRAARAPRQLESRTRLRADPRLAGLKLAGRRTPLAARCTGGRRAQAGVARAQRGAAERSRRASRRSGLAAGASRRASGRSRSPCAGSTSPPAGAAGSGTPPSPGPRPRPRPPPRARSCRR